MRVSAENYENKLKSSVCIYGCADKDNGHVDISPIYMDKPAWEHKYYEQYIPEAGKCCACDLYYKRDYGYTSSRHSK